jgi:hypothetical protein
MEDCFFTRNSVQKGSVRSFGKISVFHILTNILCGNIYNVSMKKLLIQDKPRLPGIFFDEVQNCVLIYNY